MRVEGWGLRLVLYFPFPISLANSLFLYSQSIGQKRQLEIGVDASSYINHLITTFFTIFPFPPVILILLLVATTVIYTFLAQQVQFFSLAS